METLFQDLRYAIRMLLKRPAFTAIAVISLALGIGANTTIYSLVHSVLLRPLAVEDPDRLVTITNESLAYPVYADFRDQNDVFSGLAGFANRTMSLNREGQPEIISGEVVSGNFFDVLGVKAARGRTFLPEEDQTIGTHAVVVLSHGLWQRLFGGDEEIVGKSLSLNGQSFTVVGVTPSEFRGVRLTDSPDLWIPVMMWPRVATGFFIQLGIDTRSWSWFSVVGRLKPGVLPEQAEAALNVLATRQEQEYPRDTPKGFHVELRPVAIAATGMESRSDFLRFIGLLVAVVGIALAIASANVANLLLVKATGRRKEIAVRLALGASRGRIIRQMLTESVLLAIAGGVVGLFVALWAIDLLEAYELPGGIALGRLGLGVNSQALSFTLVLATATGICFGLAPAFQASRPDLVAALKDQSASHTTGKSFLRSSLVAAQVALCLLLLVSAGLFVRSLKNALATDTGFNPDKVALVSVNLGLQRYSKEQADSFYDQLARRVETLPGVLSASWARNVPVSGNVDRESFKVNGYDPQPGERMVIDMNVVGVNYFQTMGIPLVEGREFNHQDREGSQGVVIVNEAMARRYWAGQSPLGKSLRIRNTDVVIVGVAKDSRYYSLREAMLPYLYLPLRQAIEGSGLSSITLLTRTADNPTGIIASVEREAREMDATLPLFNIKTLNEHLGNLLIAQRFGATLLGLFSLLAMTLAVIGIYGVVAYSVTQRTKEIGIRQALGAQATDILKLVLARGLAPVLIGVGLGLGAALLITRAMTSFLYGISATDITTFSSAALILIVVALVACAVPARRATKVDPMVALRYE